MQSGVASKRRHAYNFLRYIPSPLGNDSRRVFKSGARVITKKGNGVSVFNLGRGKNSNRLIAAVHFNTQIVFVQRVLTISLASLNAAGPLGRCEDTNLVPFQGTSRWNVEPRVKTLG